MAELSKALQLRTVHFRRTTAADEWDVRRLGSGENSEASEIWSATNYGELYREVPETNDSK